MKPLTEELKDWTDVEDVQFILLKQLGLSTDENYQDVKWVLYTNCPFNNLLYIYILFLKDVGFLIENEDSQFKYNKHFEFKDGLDECFDIIKILKDKEKLNGPKQIIKFDLNGILSYSTSNEISYEKICELTRLNPDHNPSIIIAYPKDVPLKNKIIFHNESVVLVDNCIITACYTGNA